MQTIHVHASSLDTKRTTSAAIVTMSGELAPPFHIFIRQQNDTIAKIELATFSERCFYTMKKKAWIDKSMMSVWVEKCLS